MAVSKQNGRMSRESDMVTCLHLTLLVSPCLKAAMRRRAPTSNPTGQLQSSSSSSCAKSTLFNTASASASRALARSI